MTTTAFIIITTVGIIGLLAIAFDNLNVLLTLGYVPNWIQAIRRN